VEYLGGAKGIGGYFLFRCKVAKPESIYDTNPNTYHAPAEAGGLLHYMGFGTELLALPLLGGLIARAAARRVYFETKNRWSASYEFTIDPGDIPAALDALFRENWPALALLKRHESDFTTRVKTAGLVFRAEFLKDCPDEPCYVSLKANRLGPSGKMAVSKFGGEGAYFVHQQPLSLESTQRFFRYFSHEIELGTPVASAHIK
jgi:hypothetical protein